MLIAQLTFIVFILAGIAIGALSHPMIFRWIFGGKEQSADHDESRSDRLFGP